MIPFLSFLKTVPVIVSGLSGLGAWLFSTLGGADFAVTFCLLFMTAAFVYGVISFLCRTPLRFVPFLRTLRGLMRLLFLLILVVFVILLSQTLSGGQSDPDPGRVDAVLVLGAGLNGETPSAVYATRLDAAADFALTHPTLPVVVTGGQGPNEAIPEALAGQRYLTAKGVDPARISVETASVDTDENIKNALPLLPPDAKTVAVVSSDYHLYRARALLRDAGFTPVGVAASAPHFYLTAVGYLREVFSLGKMWLGKI